MSSSDYTEIRVELPPPVVNRLKESSLGKRTLADEAVRMMRYALRRMFPPRTPDEWRHAVGKEDWKELLQSLHFKGGEMNSDVPDDQPYEAVLRVPADMLDRIEEIAGFKQITESEAALYTIEYALTEVFPPKTLEEANKELREAWRAIFRAVWRRSQRS